MICQQFRELIADYLAEEIEAIDLKEFQNHLEICSSCEAELKEAQALWSALEELPTKQPSPELRGRFYAMLEKEKRTLAASTRPSWPKRLEVWLGSWWPERPLIGIAVASLTLFVGLSLGSNFNRSRSADGEITALRDEVQAMNEIVSLAMLNQDSSSERLAGINLSAKVSDPSPALVTGLMNALKKDPNLNVRLASVDALGRYHTEPGIVDLLTQSLSQESSPMIQIAIIDLLIAIEETEALEALITFIKQQNLKPEVKNYAQNRLIDA